MVGGSKIDSKLTPGLLRDPNMAGSGRCIVVRVDWSDGVKKKESRLPIMWRSEEVC
jgi:hypothetical protein